MPGLGTGKLHRSSVLISTSTFVAATKNTLPLCSMPQKKVLSAPAQHPALCARSIPSDGFSSESSEDDCSDGEDDSSVDDDVPRLVSRFSAGHALASLLDTFAQAGSTTPDPHALARAVALPSGARFQPREWSVRGQSGSHRRSRMPPRGSRPAPIRGAPRARPAPQPSAPARWRSGPGGCGSETRPPGQPRSQGLRPRRSAPSRLPPGTC